MTDTLTLDALAAVKEKQQATWASGDYAVIGTSLQIIGEQLCESVDVSAGQSVLDVAAGNGNASLAAARRWCDVVATDYVPALLERARERAAAERLAIEFREADAEALPFPNGSFDVVVSTSPPGSTHLIAAAIARATGIRWVADLRDSLVAHAHRRADTTATKAKAALHERVARLVAGRADAIMCVSEAISEETRALGPRGPVVTIPNGADFDDVAGLERQPSDRFRITHTGTIFGRRDPKPFLHALARVNGDVVARFVGDFRDADRAAIAELGLGEKVELVPYLPRREALALQRDSDALLLLVPAGEGRGRFVVTTKIFEYLAAGRPILASVCSLVLILAGAIAIPTMPVAQYPPLAPPVITVTTFYTGADAQAVETAVTTPLEQAINGVEGMLYMTSSSTNSGAASISVVFDVTRDSDIAAVDVQNRVGRAASRLPAQVM